MIGRRAAGSEGNGTEKWQNPGLHAAAREQRLVPMVRDMDNVGTNHCEEELGNPLLKGGQQAVAQASVRFNPELMGHDLPLGCATYRSKASEQAKGKALGMVGIGNVVKRNPIRVERVKLRLEQLCPEAPRDVGGQPSDRHFIWLPADGKILDLGWSVGIVEGDTGTLKTPPGELTAQAMDVVCNSTPGEFKRSTDKDNSQWHQANKDE